MKRIASLFILVGTIIFIISMSILRWDFTKLSTVKYEKNKHEFVQNFRNINIDIRNANIELVYANNIESIVVCEELDNLKHSVEIIDDTLTIKTIDKRKWYEYVGINFKKTKVTIYLPNKEYSNLIINSGAGNIEIPKELKFENINISLSAGRITNYASVSNNIIFRNSTGKTSLENIDAKKIDIASSTGQVDLVNCSNIQNISISIDSGDVIMRNISSDNLNIKGRTGDVELYNVIAANVFKIVMRTGNILLEDCDGKDMHIKTSTGNVNGNLLTDKTFLLTTTTGKMDVPNTTADEICEVTTSTGDINLKIDKKNNRGDV